MVSKDESFGSFNPSDPLKPEGDIKPTDPREARPNVNPAAGAESTAYQGSPEGAASGAPSSGTAAGGTTTDEVKAGARDLGHDAQARAEQLRAEAEAKVSQAQQEARRLMDDARERGAAEAESGKRLAADEVGGIANALQTTAQQLDAQNQPYTAHYVAQAAASLDRIAQNLRNQDLGGLVQQVEDFARRQPGLFLGGAVVGGFLLARFLKSSSARHPYSPSYDTTPGRGYMPPREPGYGATTEGALNTNTSSVGVPGAGGTTPRDSSMGREAGNPDSSLNANTSAVGVPDVEKR